MSTTPAGTVPARRTRAIGINATAVVALVIAFVATVIAFTWPLYVVPGSTFAHLSGAQAPFVLALALPLVLVVVLTQISSDGIDVKALAMLGVLTAVDASLRPLGAGTAGVETVFFILVLAGYVFGPGFGFSLGCTALFASALLTSGVGPWLPYQMLASGFVGLFAGLLPQLGKRAEILMLAVFGFGFGFVFGFMMDLAFWPFQTGPTVATTYLPGASVWHNLSAFVAYCLLTAMGWDLGRAVTNAVLIVLLGPGLLLVFRRAARKAHFVAG